jgi:hypothetical protein
MQNDENLIVLTTTDFSPSIIQLLDNLKNINDSNTIYDCLLILMKKFSISRITKDHLFTKIKSNYNIYYYPDIYNYIESQFTTRYSSTLDINQGAFTYSSQLKYDDSLLCLSSSLDYNFNSEKNPLYVSFAQYNKQKNDFIYIKGAFLSCTGGSLVMNYNFKPIGILQESNKCSHIETDENDKTLTFSKEYSQCINLNNSTFLKALKEFMEISKKDFIFQLS